MEIHELFFTIGVSLWVLSTIVISLIQLEVSKSKGIYTGVFQKLNKSQIKKAKLSGFIFIVGTISLAIGFYLQVPT